MECFVCHRVFKPGEHVFFGSQMVCDGLGYMDFHYLPASDDSMGAMHLTCLKSPVTVTTTPNRAVPEQTKEQLAVTRSNALAMFEEEING